MNILASDMDYNQLRYEYSQCMLKRAEAAVSSAAGEDAAVTPLDLALEAGRLEQALRSAVAAQGKEATELENFFSHELIMLEYHKLRGCVDSETNLMELMFDRSKVQESRQRLRAFCIATGQDLEVMDQVFREEEQQLIDSCPS